MARFGGLGAGSGLVTSERAEGALERIAGVAANSSTDPDIEPLLYLAFLLEISSYNIYSGIHSIKDQEYNYHYSKNACSLYIFLQCHNFFVKTYILGYLTMHVTLLQGKRVHTTSLSESVGGV